MTGRQGRRRKQLLDDFKERRQYCELKEATIESTVWGNGFGRSYATVAM